MRERQGNPIITPFALRKTGMDVPGGYHNIGKICMCEAMGTAFLIIAINLGWHIHPGFLPFAIGLIIFMNITVFGNISGGHFNPAVTLGVLVKDGTSNFAKNVVLSIMMIISQIAGGFIGAYIVTKILVTNSKDSYLWPGIAFLCPNKSPSLHLTSDDICDGSRIIFHMFLAEFVFINIILSIKYHNGAADLVVNALCIGLTLFTAVLLIGGISGGSLNPAVGVV